MQYGRDLDRLLGGIIFTYPTLEPLYMLKADVCNVFYHIGFRPGDAPKLPHIFPMDNSDKPLVDIPLNLPIVWKNSLPLLCTATETATDL